MTQNSPDAVHPSIPLAEATSVTHFICPQGPTTDGVPTSTHHLQPVRDGVVAGEPSWVQTCSYCGFTEAQLRARNLGE